MQPILSETDRCEGSYSFLSLFSMREKEEEKNKEEKRRNPYSCFVIVDHDLSMSLVNITSTIDML